METLILREDALVGRVVEIDGMGIVEVDLDVPHRIFRAGVLAERVADRLVGRPVDLGGLLFVAVPVKNADVIGGKIFGVLVHQRDDIALDDRFGHRPVGIEIDLVDAAAQDRGLAVDAAHDRRVTLVNLLALDRLDGGGGDVDVDVAVGELAFQRPDTLEVELDLAQALGGRHRHRPVGDLVHLAVDLQAVAGLKTPDGGVDLGIEHVADPGLARKVAGVDQVFAQVADLAAIVAEHEIVDAGGGLGPAAHRGQPLVIFGDALEVIFGIERNDGVGTADGVHRDAGIGFAVGIAQHAAGGKGFQKTFLRDCRHREGRGGRKACNGLERGAPVGLGKVTHWYSCPIASVRCSTISCAPG